MPDPLWGFGAQPALLQARVPGCTEFVQGLQVSEEWAGRKACWGGTQQSRWLAGSGATRVEGGIRASYGLQVMRGLRSAVMRGLKSEWVGAVRGQRVENLGGEGGPLHWEFLKKRGAHDAVHVVSGRLIGGMMIRASALRCASWQRPAFADGVPRTGPHQRRGSAVPASHEHRHIISVKIGDGAQAVGVRPPEELHLVARVERAVAHRPRQPPLARACCLHPAATPQTLLLLLLLLLLLAAAAAVALAAGALVVVAALRRGALRQAGHAWSGVEHPYELCKGGAGGVLIRASPRTARCTLCCSRRGVACVPAGHARRALRAAAALSAAPASQRQHTHP